MDLDDYKLERSGDGPLMLPPPRPTRYLAWAAAIVLPIAIAGGLWYLLSPPKKISSPSTTVSVPSAPQPTTVPERPEAPLVKAADIDLPPLAESDPIVRELVTRLSSHPTIAAWLATKGLIANFTLVTLTVAEGRTPKQFLRPVAPRGPFRTTRSGGELFVDPRSYERYALHADAIAALDPVGTASLYLTLKPRITDAYRELGYPEGDFDRVLERAIGVLLQTPALDEKVSLSLKGVNYAYSDPKLESLSPAQKQLLRLGPRNGQAIRGKLDEIAMLLNLRPADRR
jgi:hypothetical protein